MAHIEAQLIRVGRGVFAKAEQQAHRLVGQNLEEVGRFGIKRVAFRHAGAIRRAIQELCGVDAHIVAGNHRQRRALVALDKVALNIGSAVGDNRNLASGGDAPPNAHIALGVNHAVERHTELGAFAGGQALHNLVGERVILRVVRVHELERQRLDVGGCACKRIVPHIARVRLVAGDTEALRPDDPVLHNLYQFNIGAGWLIEGTIPVAGVAGLEPVVAERVAAQHALTFALDVVGVIDIDAAPIAIDSCVEPAAVGALAPDARIARGGDIARAVGGRVYGIHARRLQVRNRARIAVCRSQRTPITIQPSCRNEVRVVAGQNGYHRCARAIRNHQCYLGGHIFVVQNLACHIDALAQIRVQANLHIAAPAQVAVHINRAAPCAVAVDLAQNQPERHAQPDIFGAQIHDVAALVAVHHEAQVVDGANLDVGGAFGTVPPLILCEGRGVVLVNQPHAPHRFHFNHGLAVNRS